MNAGKTDKQESGIEFEFEINEPPQKVWRAISMPEFRENWLPKDALADPEAVSMTDGEEISYRMRETDAPFTESMVTFRIAPNSTGGTCLRIVHELAAVRFAQMTAVAANGNSSLLMLAA